MDTFCASSALWALLPGHLPSTKDVRVFSEGVEERAELIEGTRCHRHDPCMKILGVGKDHLESLRATILG
jgi:hypothetical protein